jgi:thioredoxin reductase/ferredoxin
MWAPYALLIGLAVGWHLWRRLHRERAHGGALRGNIQAGLNEPPSLHPVIDPARCIGSGSCVRACPEHALGMVDGKATLINASACIGHGACHSACAFDAISLVFGTERRGLEIPLLQPNFETNVPGLFIAGELGGMGLIRKAAEQGRQAVDGIVQRGSTLLSVADRSRSDVLHGDEWLDLLIVGAGPAGLSASLSATSHRLRHAVIEQESSLGGAIFHYPRQKIAMTAPVTLALIGEIRLSEVSKEKLLDFWLGVTRKFSLPLRLGVRMERIEAVGDGFEIQTSQGLLRARSVLLAIGRRGTPRTLGVAGEELPKVAYRLVDPQQYQGQDVLVVGGGDSALEAAIALTETAGTRVTLSYRSAAFSRVKARNRERLADLQTAGRIDVQLCTRVERITPSAVWLKREDGSSLPRDNQAVLVCAGGVLPTPLLKDIGIRFETKHGTA